MGGKREHWNEISATAESLQKEVFRRAKRLEKDREIAPFSRSKIMRITYRQMEK